MTRNGSYRLDSIPMSAEDVTTRRSSTGCCPPRQGKRIVVSSVSARAGQSSPSQPGSGGKSRARFRKKPRALAARAADDAGLSNLPLAISSPGAARNAASTSAPGIPGRNQSDIFPAPAVIQWWHLTEDCKCAVCWPSTGEHSLLPEPPLPRGWVLSRCRDCKTEEYGFLARTRWYVVHLHRQTAHERQSSDDSRNPRRRSGPALCAAFSSDCAGDLATRIEIDPLVEAVNVLGKRTANQCGDAGSRRQAKRRLLMSLPCTAVRSTL